MFLFDLLSGLGVLLFEPSDLRFVFLSGPIKGLALLYQQFRGPNGLFGGLKLDGRV